jgi:hypothetical protein
MTICLYGTVVQSPAAKTPGTEVCAALVDDDLAAGRELDGLALSHSVFGSSPIWTKTPSRSTV